MRAVAIVAAVSLLIASALAQDPAAACSNIQLSGNTYDLTWWVGKGPFSKSDATGQYTWKFQLCSTLADACPDNSDGGQTNACGTPGSAYVCQNWPNTQNPAQPFTACCAGKSAQPTFAPYSGGADTGIVATYGGGDDCGVCAPSTRATAFTIICDPQSTSTPNIVSAANADLPSPVYNIQIRHCSGCYQGQPGFCGGGGAGGLTAGGVMLIILVVCAVVYFAGGFVFCRFARHKEGKEAIPNYEFWTDLPALIKDGVRFAISPCTGGSSYETVKG